MNKEEFYNDCYEKHYGDIFRMARKILGNEHDADDIAQSVFLKFWSIMDKYDPSRSSVKTFIIMLFVNNISAFFKSKKVLDDAIYHDFDFVTDKIHDETDYHFVIEEDTSMQEILNYLFLYLKTDDFIIFYLRLLGWSFKDIARLFGITNINCTVRYFRIKNKLKTSFLINGGKNV